MLQVKVTGDTEAKLRAAQRRLGNMSPAMRGIGGYMVSQTVKGFATEGRDGKWPPLADATRIYKAKHKKEKILSFNRMLAKSIVSRPAAARVEIGGSLPYGAIHQFGGLAGRGHKSKIPARPYLVVTTTDEKVIQKILNDHIAGRH